MFFCFQDLPTICHEGLELKHDDMDLTKELLIGEELVVELYNLKEGKLRYENFRLNKFKQVYMHF